MLLLGILMLITFGGATVALAKRMNRPLKLGAGTGGRALGAKSGRAKHGSSRSGRATRAGRTGTSRTSSGGARHGRSTFGGWATKAWNASGAPKTSETTLGGVSAVLTGKAAGAATRGGWWAAKRTGRAGKWFAGRALIPFDRWLERKRAGLENAAELRDTTPATPDPAGDAATPAEPEPAAAPARVNPFRSNRSSKGEPVDTMPTPFDRAAVPNTLAAHLNHIAELAPETDADLLNFLRDEVTGMLAYAEAINTMFEHCVTEQGLDPAAMQGVSDYAEAFAENANAAAAGHKQFMAVYEAIIEAANNGTQMPYNGRFFSGEAA